jgi:hypothetical protein
VLRFMAVSRETWVVASRRKAGARGDGPVIILEGPGSVLCLSVLSRILRGAPAATWRLASAYVFNWRFSLVRPGAYSSDFPHPHLCIVHIEWRRTLSGSKIAEKLWPYACCDYVMSTEDLVYSETYASREWRRTLLRKNAEAQGKLWGPSKATAPPSVPLPATLRGCSSSKTQNINRSCKKSQ